MGMSQSSPSTIEDYFTIAALENGLTVKLSKTALSYRIDGGSWTSLAANTATSSINAGQRIQIKINNPTISDGIGTFTVNKKFNVEGNIMSLLHGDNYKSQTSLSGKNSAFKWLFKGCTYLQSAENLYLPATTLAVECYHSMFYDCKSLTKAPTLPATTLGQYCYSLMFGGCELLETAPALPATSLSKYCYDSMFYGCKKLITAPTLPATSLAEGCYEQMFQNCTSLKTGSSIPSVLLSIYCCFEMYSGCTSLVTAPSLPSTRLNTCCYYGMFRGCSSLTKAPSLPATTLSTECYSYMFDGCTSLVTAPTISATTLATKCFDSMFSGCKSLKTPPSLPVTTLAEGCYYDMFRGCTSLVTPPSLPATTLATDCYNGMFSYCSSLTTAPELNAIRLKKRCYSNMFNGCSKLNYIKMLGVDICSSSCLANWVNGVASSGSFVKHQYMNTLPRGVNGIPVGWTVTEVTDPYSQQYFTIVPLETGTTIGMTRNKTKISYRINNASKMQLTNWTELAIGSTTPASTTGDKFEFKMVNPKIDKDYGIGTFTVSKSFDVEGNIMSLIYGADGDNFKNRTSLTSEGALAHLFTNNTMIKSAENLSLPAQTLSKKCYYNMFNSCPNLTTPPKFVPAVTLAVKCCEGMFYECTKLNIDPILTAKTLDEECYSFMFFGCTSLKEAPSLVSTSLKNNCYYAMFGSCSALETAPDLPATSLADYCYYEMFGACSSLQYGPDLPAETLTRGCYTYMFTSCFNLRYLKALYVCNDLGWLGTAIGQSFIGSTKNGTFVKNIRQVRNEYACPSGWTIKVSCETPSIVNLTKHSITFTHSGGALTVSPESIQMIPNGITITSIKPDFNLIVNIVYNSEGSGDNGETLKENASWSNAYNLNTLLSTYNVNTTYSGKIAIVIKSSPDLPDDGYYYNTNSISLDDISLDE